MTSIHKLFITVFLFFVAINACLSQSFNDANWQQKDSMIATLYTGGAFSVVGVMIDDAYRIEKEKTDPDQEAVAVFSMWKGIRYLTEQKTEDAETFFNESITLFESLPDYNSSRYRDALLNMADLQAQKGNSRQSLETVEKAIELMEKDLGSQPAIYLATLLQAVDAAIQGGELEKAENFSRKALTYAQSKYTNQSDEYFQALQSVGQTYLAQGETRRASNLILQAYELAKSNLAPDHINRVYYGNNAVTVLKKMGRYSSAEKTYQEMLQFFEDNSSFKNDNLFPVLLDDVGAFYEEIGDLAKAYEYYNKANVLFALRIERTDPTYIKSQINVGNILSKQNKYTEAESYYLDALQHIQTVYGENSWSEAILRDNLADIYFELAQYGKSLEQREVVKDIAELVWGPNHQEFASALFDLGKTQAKLGNHQNALEYQETAYTKLAQLYGKNHLKVYEVAKALADFYQVEDPSKAINYYQECMDFIHQYSRTILPLFNTNDRMVLMQDFNQLIARFSAYVLGLDNPPASTIAALQNAFINWKGTGQLPDLGDLATKFISPSAQLRQQYGAWQSLRQGIIDAQALTIVEQKEQDLDLNDLIKQTQLLQTKMLPTFASSHYKSQMGLKSINEIKLSLAADDILIDFNEILSYDPTNNSYSKNGLYLAFITAGNLAETKMFPLQLNKNVLETDQLTSQAIYASQIWQPLAMHIPEKGRLIICPDGVLNRVSFYMLPASDGKVLLDQHEITIVPNFKIMALTPNQISSAETLMVGAVDYYQSSHDTLAEMPNNLLKINSIEIADATFRSNHQFTQTTNSVQELNTLAALLLKKKKKVEMLTSKEASKSNLHRLLDKNKYNVLHLSMPAFLLEKSDSTFSELIVPNLNSSGLALAGSYNSWSVDSLASGVIDDGLLTAAEIQTLDLATTDLVVMPSINGSSSSQGVSLSSLQHAFLDAGAKYVIVSLWPALEKDRLAFFQLFYKNLLKTASVKTAFRKTQLQVKKKSDAKYWAGYILTP